MNKYSGLFKNYLATSLEYRANIIGSFIFEVLGIVGIFIFWVAIFRTYNHVANYDINKTVLYYFFVPLAGSISTVYISDKFGEEIKNGFFSNYLLKPNKVWLNAISYAFAFKVNYLTIVLPLYFFIMVIFIIVKHISFITLPNLFIGLSIASGAFLMHCLLDLAICWLAFWVDDVWAFKHFKYIVFALFGGISFPLDFLPFKIKLLFEALPFKFLYYVPVSYFLGIRRIDNLVADLLIILLWSLLFMSIGSLLLRAGLKKYGAFGN